MKNGSSKRFRLRQAPGSSSSSLPLSSKTSKVSRPPSSTSTAPGSSEKRDLS